MLEDPKLPAVHREYHDVVYGYPVEDDNELFGRLVLELNQAGLSWTTILNKQENFRAAYSGFDVAAVARYGEADRNRLLGNPGIIRNRLKVDAAIVNARRIVEIAAEFGSFKEWLNMQVGFDREAWVRLFKVNFKFTGGEITNEFLLSSGYLEGAHIVTCPVYEKIMARRPAWAQRGVE